MKWLVLVVVIALFGLNVHAYDYPTRIHYLRDIGTKYTGQVVSFTAEITTNSGQECNDCVIWFYVDGPSWKYDHWVGPVQYSGYSKSGLYSMQWKIPIDAAEGTYTYYARIQDSHPTLMGEDSEVYTFRVVRESRKAKIISLWPVDDVKAGDRVSFWAQVQNTGDRTLDLDCKVRFYVRITSGESYTDNYAGERRCNQDDWSGAKDVFSTGETRWFKVDWETREAARYTYWATVEYDNREISENPPSYSFNVLEPRSANIEMLEYTGNVPTGRKVTLRALVENTEDIVLASGCRVLFWVKGQQKGGKLMEGEVGTVPCDQTESTPEPLYYQEKRWYTMEWKPPMDGDYTYYAVVQYKQKDISSVSGPQSFHVGVDVTTTTEPEEPIEETPETILPETIPPTTEPVEETTTTQEDTTTTSSSTITTTTEQETPKVVGQVTGINLDNPLISFITTALIMYALVYTVYHFSRRTKKEPVTEEKKKTVKPEDID